MVKKWFFRLRPLQIHIHKYCYFLISSGWLLLLHQSHFKYSWSPKGSFVPFVNLFNVTGLFWYPLKTSKNLWYSEVFREYRKRTMAWNGLVHCFYANYWKYIILKFLDFISYLLGASFDILVQCKSPGVVFFGVIFFYRMKLFNQPPLFSLKMKRKIRIHVLQVSFDFVPWNIMTHWCINVFTKINSEIYIFGVLRYLVPFVCKWISYY